MSGTDVKTVRIDILQLMGIVALYFAGIMLILVRMGGYTDLRQGALGLVIAGLLAIIIDEITHLDTTWIDNKIAEIRRWAGRKT